MRSQKKSNFLSKSLKNLFFSIYETLYSLSCPTDQKRGSYILYIIYCIVFGIRAFHLVSYFYEEAHEPLNQNKRSKYQLWVWCHCNLCTLSGLCLSCNLNHLKSYFPDIFNELFFLCASSISPKSISSSHHRTRWLMKSRTWLMWNAYMWLTNLPKAVCAALSPLQMSNQISKFIQ